MLYHLLYPLSTFVSSFNIFRYITFRSITAALIAMLVVIVFGKYFIQYVGAQNGVIRKFLPENHRQKAQTTSMGGIVIFFGLFIALAFSGNWLNHYLLLGLFTFFSFSLLGLFDDLAKLRGEKKSRGLPLKLKLGLQITLSALICFLLLNIRDTFLLFQDGGEILLSHTQVMIPFSKDLFVDFGWLYWFFAVFVMVASTNAVNLSDGLDGLAVGLSFFVIITFVIFSYLSGHKIIADYLRIPFIQDLGELTVFLSALAGACLGFLWYNAHPAQIFMGDTGSLALGAVIGFAALSLKAELILLIAGGIFVAEAGSVILQVSWYKLKKKRIFKMAPVHHHFEILGMSESKIIARFWIVGIILALLAIASLKIR